VGQLDDRCSVPDPADARWDQNSSQRDDGRWRLAVEGDSGLWQRAAAGSAGSVRVRGVRRRESGVGARQVNYLGILAAQEKPLPKMF
jgi:hypothetical protein